MTQEYHKLLNNPQFYVDGFHEYSEVAHCDQSESYVYNFLEIIWLSMIERLMTFGIPKDSRIQIPTSYVERIQLSFDTEEVLKVNPCQNLEVKQQNGEVVSAYRMARQKSMS